MNNYQWLLQMDGADRKAWFDAEHVENQERALDGDTESENEDSRDKLGADAKRYIEYAACDARTDVLWADETFTLLDAVIELLDRQAAITEEQTRCKWVTASADEIAAWRSKAEKMKEQVYELTAECDKLQEKLRIGWECECKLQAERDELQQQVDELNAENDELQTRVYKLTADLFRAEADCERYRSKFGKCLDYADAIHALMDDEGMA